jgi:hypothetical protein
MKCPHCRVAFHDTPSDRYLGEDSDGHWGISVVVCAACGKAIFTLQRSSRVGVGIGGEVFLGPVEHEVMVYPRGTGRPPLPAEVPPEVAEDYTEACLVLTDSPKASAALSRRCLQNLLRTAGEVKPGDLAGEIAQVLGRGNLPSLLAQSIDAVRHIGNFSAHPLKSTSTGEVLPVEPQEAEWNLEVLEALFDFYYVQPAILEAKRDSLNVKLAEAGKLPMI